MRKRTLFAKASPLQPRHLLSPTGGAVLLMAGLVTALLAPLPLHAQRGYMGTVVGRTATQLPDNLHHYGSMAGAFLQVDMSDHVGFRTEASWVRTGALEYSPEVTAPPAGVPVISDIEYAEVNATGQLSWRSTPLAPLGSWVGITAFGGGWLGTRFQGAINGENPRAFDFGHLLGFGFNWGLEPVLLQVDVRSSHGEIRYWKEGPKRRGSQLVVSLGYQFH